MRTVAGSTDRIVVIGAGLAGLSAALHLAGRGREVTVVERHAVPGGRAGRRDVAGHLLDTGPTVLTMPGVVEDTFAAVGASMEDRLRMIRLDPAYRAHFVDGSVLDVRPDAEAMAEEIRVFAGPKEAAGYRRLRRWLLRLYEVEFERFIGANVDSPLGLLGPKLAQLTLLGGFGPWERAVRRFVHDERLQRVFTFQALYAGVAPRNALALYAVIAYMDTIGGVYFPYGGMRALPDALAGAAADAGVTFRYATTVASLERRGRRVVAVRTEEGDRIECDAVVISCELAVAYRLLGCSPRRVWALRSAPSAVVLHLSAPSVWTGTLHHNLLFGQAWDGVFDDLVLSGRLMRDPSLLLTRPTATDRSLAPPGRQLLSLLAPVPNLTARPADWDSSGPAYARRMLDVVAGRLGFAPSTVETLHLVTPADWDRLGLVAGTPFSLSHTFRQTGPFRPGNVPRSAENAVLAGCGTVPGVGIPSALMSGRLAADRITGVPRGRRGLVADPGGRLVPANGAR
ncbi:phytoene desaturase family protein [Actinoallomurus rhizosphaericola]|uniref:phytoene desaturase family protein n=1 Tax=Actinoallomurus rhizosphaericola TaxID=2952536 RepID=UPI00209172A4|nr:phytoene desaturase family protein [Actinoallomurus rhizosphaericola]MCO5994174.1 phytoene desaturase family protein [Actinoallomurus rhizosphaericola]